MKRSFWLWAALATFVSLFLQVGGLSHEAVIDDHGWMHDPAQRGCSVSAWDCFQHPQLRYYYRPLVAVDFLLGKRCFHAPTGANEAYPFHVESLIQHGIVVLLVFWLFRLLFRRDLPALLAGVLFALHPLNVPVTTFIGGRTDNLALIFIALFAIGLLKAGTKYKSVAFLISLVGFMAALFTKEQCVLLVALAPLLATMHAPQNLEKSTDKPEIHGWRRLWWQGAYALPIGVYLGMAHRVGQTMQAEDAASHAVHRSFFAGAAWSVALHLEMIGRTCWYYLCAFLFPTVSRMHQSTLGPWDWAALGPLGRNAPPEVPTPPSLWLAVGGYAALGFAVWLLWRTWHNRPCRFCMLWLFLTLLPCLNIIPVPSQFIAPYRALIPLVGICGMAGVFFTRLLDMAHPREASLKGNVNKDGFTEENSLNEGSANGDFAKKDFERVFTPNSRSAVPFVVWTVLAAICDCLIWGTLADVPQWKNDGTLMQAEIRYDRNFLPAKTGEAYLYDIEGKNEQAIASYDQAVHQLLPEARTIEDVIRAGLAPDMPRRIASASSLRYNDVPYLATSIAARGGLKQRIGWWDGAAEDYRAALALNPNDPTMGDWLAYAYDHAGNLTAEEAALKAQIARRADSYRLAQLGNVYFKQERWALARDTLARALAAPPSNTGSVVDIALARQQYEEAFARALPTPPKRK